MPGPLYILLDRDGVINRESVDFIKSPDEWLPLSGSLEAIALFNRQGYKVVVITNQSGISRGKFDAAMLKRIHDKMCTMAAQAGGAIERIYYCPHGPEDDCACRKPKPGLLEAFAADYQAVLDGIFFIGDSFRDLEAGWAAGARPALVKTGNGLETLNQHPDLTIPVFENLYDAAPQILSRQ